MTRRTERDIDADDPGFQFPCDIEVTAMGNADSDLHQTIPGLLEEAGFEVHHKSVSHRPSRQGNYVAVRLKVHFESRETYRQAHQLLRDHGEIHFTL